MTWLNTRKSKRPSIEVLEDRCLLAYTVTDLGTLGGNTSYAYGINDAGTVVGESRVTGFRYTHGFTSTGEAMQDLGVINNKFSRAEDINGAGHIVGSSNYFAGSAALWTGVIWKNGTKVNLGAFGGPFSYGTAINTGGFAVGYANYSASAQDKFHAFKYDPNLPASQKLELGTLGGDDSKAHDINDAGQVVGEATNLTGEEHAVIWNGTEATDIGVLPGFEVGSEARGINNLGQVVGGSFKIAGVKQQIIYHGFIYSGGTLTDLGTIGTGGYSFAYDINDLAQVVGSATIEPAPNFHAFIWFGGVMTDLNDMIPGGSGWVLTHAYAINNNGEIVGHGVKDGQIRAFKLTPSSSPISTSRTMDAAASASMPGRQLQPLVQSPTTFEAAVLPPASNRATIDVSTTTATETKVRAELKRVAPPVRNVSVAVTANLDEIGRPGLDELN